MSSKDSAFQPRRFLRRDGLIDRIAISLSGLCLLHCVATVFLVALLSQSALFLQNPLFHEIGLGIAIALGLFGLGKGFVDHGRVVPTLIGTLGLGIMFWALQLGHGIEEMLVTMAGVAILALGHFLNHRAVR